MATMTAATIILMMTTIMAMTTTTTTATTASFQPKNTRVATDVMTTIDNTFPAKSLPRICGDISWTKIFKIQSVYGKHAMEAM